MKKNDIVNYTVDLIEHMINDGEKEKLSLDEISERIGYSKFHLNRVFCEKTGVTIHQYIMERRLTEAARRLAQTDDAVCDISYEAGYQSQQAFSYAFRTIYLYSPLQYRERRAWIPLRMPYIGSRIIRYQKTSGLEMAA